MDICVGFISSFVNRTITMGVQEYLEDMESFGHMPKHSLSSGTGKNIFYCLNFSIGCFWLLMVFCDSI